MPLPEDTLQHLLANLLALPHPIVLHACLSKLLVVFTEPPDARAGRHTWIEKKAGNGNWQRDDAINDKDPAPKVTRVRELREVGNGFPSTYQPAMPPFPSRPA